MENRSKIILVGGFHEVVELCATLNREIVGIIDRDLAGTYLGHPILGRDEDAPKLFERFREVPVVLTPDAPAVREKLWVFYQKIGFRLSQLLHPAAYISGSARIGRGVVVQHGANISCAVEIGDGVKLNTRANVMHDVRIGEFSTIAPDAVILGRVQIGRGCYIGANATLLPGIQVGDRAIVGAGAVVTRPVPANTTVKGNPAR